MQKFIVLYMAPAEGLAEWAKTPEETRKVEEAKMREAWNVWMKAHGSIIRESAGVGKTKRVDSAGITDTSNDVMLFSIVEAESQQVVAETFKTHPHFGIPNAWIEIMPANYLPQE